MLAGKLLLMLYRAPASSTEHKSRYSLYATAESTAREEAEGRWVPATPLICDADRWPGLERIDLAAYRVRTGIPESERQANLVSENTDGVLIELASN